MGTARDDFLERLGVFRGVATLPVLVNKAPSEREHNDSARLLRNGLAVVAFTLLEDFLRRRFEEAARCIDGNQVRFEDLPEKLRAAATAGVVHSLSSQVRLRSYDEPERNQLIWRSAASLTSTKQAAFDISPLLFGSRSSNLSVSEISDLLSILRVDGGWQALNAVAGRARLGVPALEESFRRFSQTRHAAAHDASTEVSPPDLESFYLEALAVGLAFDVLISRACRLLGAGDAAVLAGNRIDSSTVAIRFVEPSARGWREIEEGRSRAAQVHPDRATAVTSAIARAKSSGQVVVALDASGTPDHWWCTDTL